MKKMIRHRPVKLSLSSEKLRWLTVPDLARAQGGLYYTFSACVDVDENTVVHHSNYSVQSHPPECH